MKIENRLQSGLRCGRCCRRQVDIGLQNLSSVGAGCRLIQENVRRYGGADEEGFFVGVVIDQVDADGEALDDLDEVAGGVFGGEECEGGAGAVGEAGDAALEGVVAAVHVDVEVDGLADAECGELGFLEVGVDPDFGEGADGHDGLAGDDIVAGVDVAAGNDAINFGADIGVGEIEVGLVEIALGLEEFCFGLLDAGGVFEQLLVDAVDVAVGIAAEELVDHFLGGLVDGGGGDAELGGGLEQLALGLADGGEGLVEIGGYLCEILAGERLGAEAEGDADLVDGLEGFFELGFCDGEGFLAGFEFIGGNVAGPDEGHGAVVIALGFYERGFLGLKCGDACVEEGDLVVDIFDGMFECEACGAGLTCEGLGLGVGGGEIGLGCNDGGLGDVDLDLVGLLVELDEEVAFADAVVVIDVDAGDLAGDARGDEGEVAVDVGVVGGDGGEGADGFGGAEVEGEEEDDGEDEVEAPAGFVLCGGRRVGGLRSGGGYGGRRGCSGTCCEGAGFSDVGASMASPFGMSSRAHRAQDAVLL